MKESVVANRRFLRHESGSVHEKGKGPTGLFLAPKNDDLMFSIPQNLNQCGSDAWYTVRSTAISNGRHIKVKVPAICADMGGFSMVVLDIWYTIKYRASAFYAYKSADHNINLRRITSHKPIDISQATHHSSSSSSSDAGFFPVLPPAPPSPSICWSLSLLPPSVLPPLSPPRLIVFR